MDFTLNLPEWQVKVLGEIFLEEIRGSWKIELLCTLIELLSRLYFLNLLGLWKKGLKRDIPVEQDAVEIISFPMVHITHFD